MSDWRQWSAVFRGALDQGKSIGEAKREANSAAPYEGTAAATIDQLNAEIERLRALNERLVKTLENARYEWLPHWEARTKRSMAAKDLLLEQIDGTLSAFDQQEPSHG